MSDNVARHAIIAEALRVSGGSPARAAAATGLSRSTVQRALRDSAELRAVQAAAANRDPKLSDLLRQLPAGSYAVEIVQFADDPGSAERSLREQLAAKGQNCETSS